MDKRAGPVVEISLERGEISLTGMEISPYNIMIAGIPHRNNRYRMRTPIFSQ